MKTSFFDILKPMQPKPKILAIVGMTATGKSALAIEVAKKFNGEIISVDSRQIYRGMDIGTNKEIRDLGFENKESPGYVVGGILHHLIDIADPDQTITLADIQPMAFKIIEDILKRGKLPILVGGTGLYTSAIVENWQLPQAKPNLLLREELNQMSEAQLFSKLEAIDPEKAKTIDKQNRRRMVRALEIAENFAEEPSKGEPKYEALLLGIDMPREEVYQRINDRVDRMVKDGLVEEVKKLGEKYGYETVAMSAVGYQQIGWHLQGKMSLAEAVEFMKKATRHYAKRQMTWWNKHGEVKWVKNTEEGMSSVDAFLK